jgi:hypothetical protein
MEDNNKTKINSPQPKESYIKSLSQLINIVIGPKHVSPIPLNIFIKHLYII